MKILLLEMVDSERRGEIVDRSAPETHKTYVQ